MGEPAKYERRQLGVKVILFLLFFLVVAYFLKREFWRDVH
jgi:ubiquinol-cytochrome c reductase cytochrome c1 subunit